MTDEEYIKKIGQAIRGFEHDEDARMLFDRLQVVRDYIEDWKSERDNSELARKKRSLRTPKLRSSGSCLTRLFRVGVRAKSF